MGGGKAIFFHSAKAPISKLHTGLLTASMIARFVEHLTNSCPINRFYEYLSKALYHVLIIPCCTAYFMSSCFCMKRSKSPQQNELEKCLWKADSHKLQLRHCSCRVCFVTLLRCCHACPYNTVPDLCFYFWAPKHCLCIILYFSKTFCTSCAQ